MVLLGRHVKDMFLLRMDTRTPYNASSWVFMTSTPANSEPPEHILFARDAALSTWIACIAMGIADGLLCATPEFPSTASLMSASLALHCGLACLLSPVLAGVAWMLARIRTRLGWSWTRTMCVLAGLGALAVCVFFGLLSSRGVILSALPPRPFFLLGLFGCVGLLSTVALRRALSAQLRPLRAWGLVSLASLILGATLFATSNAHLEALALHAVSSKPIARFVRSQADHDKDTYPASYCLRACDCDDTSADVFPGGPAKWPTTDAMKTVLKETSF